LQLFASDNARPIRNRDCPLGAWSSNLVPESDCAFEMAGVCWMLWRRRLVGRRGKRLLKISQPRCSIFHPCTRIAELDKRYYSHGCTTSSRFGQAVGNKLVRGRRRNENQTCDSNNGNSRRSSVIGLCAATIGYLPSAWGLRSSYRSPHRRQRAVRV
jgi:hypothetical protein